MSTGSGPLDFEGLATALLSHSRGFLSVWFPAGKLVGHEYKVGSLRGEAGSSLSVNVDTGEWADFAGDVKGGDIISLYAAIEGIQQGEAAKRLAQEIGFNLSPNGTPKHSPNGNGTKPEPKIVKPPAGTAPPSMRHFRHGEPSSSWCYLDAAGEALFWIARYDPPGQRKEFVPWTWNGSQWDMKAWPEPRPLFGLDILAEHPDAPVLIVEGEKAADAARTIVGVASVVVSWPGGAAAWSKVDWSPLKGRKVLLWPDADRHTARTEEEAKKSGVEVGGVLPYGKQPGPRAMEGIAAIVAAICPEVKIIDVGIDLERAEGWDAADAVEDGWSSEAFEAWAARRAKIFARTPVDSDAASDDAAAGKGEWEAPVPFETFRLPTFRTDVFTGWLRRFVEGEAVATQTPPDLAAMLVLATLAVACAKKVAVLVRAGWIEPVNIFVAVALPPGSRKSSVFSDVEEPVRTFEREIAQDAEGRIAEAETRYSILQGQLENARTKAAKGGPDAAKSAQEAVDLAKELAVARVPARPRLIADDVTPERLATLLKEQDGRMAVLSAEGGIFEIMAGRYSNAANFEIFLKGHAGDSFNVDRVGRPPEHVPHPALTLGLAVQPSVLAGLAGKPGFRGRGLLGRFAYSLPVNNLGRRMIEPPPLAQEVWDDYKWNLQALLALPFSKDEQGEIRTELLRLSPEAAKRVTEFQSRVEPQLAELGALGAMTDWAGKLVGLVVRLAGLLHTAEHSQNAAPWNIPIACQTVERAIRIGEYLIPHARAAYTCMGADPAVEDAKRVLAWVRREGLSSFSKRQLFQALRGYFKRVSQLEPALSVLAEHSYVRFQTVGPRLGAGRKPSPVYEVNPIFLSTSHDSEDFENCGDPAGGSKVPSGSDEISQELRAQSDASSQNTRNPQNCPTPEAPEQLDLPAETSRPSGDLANEKAETLSPDLLEVSEGAQ